MADQSPVSTPLVLEKKVVGQTFLAKFSLCPRSAYFYRLFPKRTHQMARGIVWHGGIDEATGFMIENEEPRMSGDVAREFVDGYAADHPEYILPANERDALRLMAWNWGEATTLDLEHVLGHEVEVAIEINGWTVRMRIDLVLGYAPEYVVVKDYKTSLAMPSDEEVQRMFQALMYSLGVFEGIPAGSAFPLGAGVNEIEFVLEFPRYRDKEHGHLKTRRAAFSRKDIQDFKFDLTQILDQVELAYETQDWPAIPGSHCSECPAQAMCPIRPDLRELPEITDELTARVLASKADVMERQLKRLKAGLKGWASETGQPIYFGSDLAFSIEPTSRTSVDRKGLVAAANQRAEFGTPFVESDFVKTSDGTKFAKRRLTEEERDG